MNAHSLNQVEVVIDVAWLDGELRMGVLHRQSSRAGDVYSFEFDDEWLARKDSVVLDPDLFPVRGRNYPPVNRTQFGVFMDSSPDRWGRTLMQRRETLRAAQEQRPVRSLTDWDYLLGVHDRSRLGALRFRATPQSAYLDDADVNAAPPLTSLRELDAAVRTLESADQTQDARIDAVLDQLLVPGSSLGGARPKASVVDEENRLCIAKFPSRQDEWDVGAWEFIAHKLAARAGLRVPSTRCLKLTSDGHTFLAQRFDRTREGRRVAFVSAMTLLQRLDGESGASYLELVDLLQSRGSQTSIDCEELFRRVVFSICISNTDDHLRNHGFIVEPTGLTLSPVFDINPNPQRRQLSLAIDESDATPNLEVAMAASKAYGLSLSRARDIVNDVSKATAPWSTEAKSLGIRRNELELMRPAFIAV